MDAVLCPQLYAILTCGGDGSGIVARLEAEVRKRAEEEWRKSGEPDPDVNWRNAERQLVWLKGSGADAKEGKIPGKDELLELKELRRQDVERQAELAALQKRLQEVESPLHTQIANLQEELACTDRLLVERNQHCREVELANSAVMHKLNLEDSKLASVKEELSTARAAAQAAEERCRSQEAVLQELREQCRALQLQYALKVSTVMEGQDVGLDRCGQSRIRRSQSGGMLAKKLCT